jgi:lactoylglutathione lyase
LKARIEHVAIWTRDLEIMRAFYTEAFGGSSGRLYENRITGFKSYFVSFGDGPRLELMHQPGRAPSAPAAGCAHIALALGSRAAVDEAIARLRQRGVSVESDPRVTGDGYYEAVILDPERNRIELTD